MSFLCFFVLSVMGSLKFKSDVMLSEPHHQARPMFDPAIPHLTGRQSSGNEHCGLRFACNPQRRIIDALRFQASLPCFHLCNAFYVQIEASPPSLPHFGPEIQPKDRARVCDGTKTGKKFNIAIVMINIMMLLIFLITLLLIMKLKIIFL